jgi:hypothetical protein
MNSGRGSDTGRGRGRGRGNDRRSGRAGRGRITSGRRLFRHEQDHIVCTFALLSEDSRRELIQLLQGMSRETVSVPAAVVGAAGSSEPSTPVSGSRSPVKSPGRVKIYQRDIIKDLPGVKEFSAMSSSDRSNAHGINRLMSTATGVIARARKQGLTDQQILDYLMNNHDDIATLSTSFKPVQKSESDEDEEGAMADQETDSVMEEGQKSAILSLSKVVSKIGVEQTRKKSWASDCESTSGEESPGSSRKKRRRSGRKTGKNSGLKLNYDVPPKEGDKGPRGPPPAGGASGEAIGVG